MEIYRTDGGGKSFADERLFNLVKSISKYTNSDFFERVEVIKDHKGTLKVKLKKDSGYDLEYYYAVFITFWYSLNECLVSIFVEDTYAIGFELDNF